jgi:Mg-chelatase subunit ChlD
MPLYADIITASQETATKLLFSRQSAEGGARSTFYDVCVDTGGGATACVDWTPGGTMVNISLPTMLPSANLTRAEADRIVGYLAHECCHVLHTDKDEWKLAVAAGARVQAWTNALEDVRIEREEIRAGRFPNLKNVLSALMNAVHGEAGVALHRQGLPAMGGELSDAPYYACLLGRLANGYAVPTAAGLMGALAPHVRPIVERALAGVPGCQSTREIRELALQLVAMEQALPKQPKPEQPKGEQPKQGKQGKPQAGKSEPGDGEAQAGQGEAQTGQGEAGEGKAEGEAEAGQGEPQEAGKGKGGKRGAKGSHTGDELGAGLDPSPTLTPVAKAVGERSPDKVPGKPTDDHDEHRQRVLIKHAADAVGAGVTQDYRSADPAVVPADQVTRRRWHRGFAKTLDRASVLQGEIARMLVSEEVRQTTHHEHTGRLDRRALTRMRAGATDVFSRRRDRPGVETAVLINVDLSASMGECASGRMAMARNAAWQLANAAELAGAKVAVVGFRALRENKTNLEVAKGWADPLQQVGPRIGRLHAQGGTHLAPAIMGGARMLTETGANRLVQIMLTDGMCSFGAVAVAECCGIARDTLDVETVAVGIQAPEVVGVFPSRHSVNIDQLSDLTNGALRSLAGMLEDGGRE